MLKNHFYEGLIEAGCDEAGRGCLAGSVYAAAVILPPDYHNEQLNDSKQLTDRQRKQLRSIIEHDALAWAVGIVTPAEIDKINILRASFLAMHRALDQLKVRPEALIIDGNRFTPYHPSLADGNDISRTSYLAFPTVGRLPVAFPRTSNHSQEAALPHTCIVKGDAKYLSIAAASILAKTYRDDYMDRLAEEYPQYDWEHNKGYPTRKHREAIRQYGTTPYHRLSYNLLGDGQLSIPF